MLRPAKYQPPPTSAETNNNKENRQFTAGSSFRGRLLAPGKLGLVERELKQTGTKLLELSVIELVLRSVQAGQAGEKQLALERARNALDNLEKLKVELRSQQERRMTSSARPFELGLMVQSNLGAQLEAAGQLREALELYTNLCRLASSGGGGGGGGGGGSSGGPHWSSTNGQQSSNHLNFNFNLSNSSREIEWESGAGTGTGRPTSSAAADSPPFQLTVGGPQQAQTRSLLHKFGLNIGNVYYRLNDFKRALKYYRLTLDRLSSMANLTAASSPEEATANRQTRQHPHQLSSRQLKLKLMNNISLALAEQHRRRTTSSNNNNNNNNNNMVNNNNEGGGGNHNQETITSLRLLLADNLTMTRARRQEQQAPLTGRPEVANANHHAFGLNLIASMAASGTGDKQADMTAALESLLRLDICHHFQRVLDLRLSGAGSKRPLSVSGRQPARAQAGQPTARSDGSSFGEVRALANKPDEPIAEPKDIDPRELILLTLVRLRSDQLERTIQEREQQITRCLLLSCQLIDRLAGSSSELCLELLTGSGSNYKHLAHDYRLSRAFQFERTGSQRQLHQLAALMKEIELTVAADSDLEQVVTPMVMASSCLVNLSQSRSEDKSRVMRAQRFAQRSSQQQINLANCYLAEGKLGLARHLYEGSINNRRQARYNLAILGRFEGAHDLLVSLVSHLLESRNCTQILLARKLFLSSLQAILAALKLKEENERLLPEALKLLGELARAGRQPADVYLLASKMADSEPVDSFALNQTGGYNQRVNSSGIKGSLLMLQQANREHPYHLPVLERLIALNISNFDYQTARLLIGNCIKNRPDQVRWYQMLAECYRREADYENATKTYRLAADRFPHETSCLKALIKLAEELGLEGQRKSYEEKLERLLGGAR